MIKKRALAAGRQFGKTGWTADQIWWDEMWNNAPRLETGYADNQPSHPHWVKPCNYSIEQWHDMGEWMNKTFGHSNWGVIDGTWVGSNRKYWFRNKSDRTLFLLKWSR